MASHPLEFSEDLQDTIPATRIGLSRAGVSRSAKAIRLAFDGGEHYMDATVSQLAEELEVTKLPAIVVVHAAYRYTVYPAAAR